MQRYLLVSRHLLFDYSSGDFIAFDKKSLDCEIDIPFFLWDFDGFDDIGPDGKLYNLSRYTTVCGDVRIQFNRVNTFTLGGVIVFIDDNYSKSSISINDGAQKIKIFSRLCTRSNRFDDMKLRDMMYIIYRIEIENTIKKYTVPFSGIKNGISDFRTIPDLAYFKYGVVEEKLKRVFSHGMVFEKWSIKYKGRILNDKYFVLLCGSWAILFDERLNFAALLLLDGVKPYELSVYKIIHQQGGYLSKIAMLS